MALVSGNGVVENVSLADKHTIRKPKPSASMSAMELHGVPALCKVRMFIIIGMILAIN